MGAKPLVIATVVAFGLSLLFPATLNLPAFYLSSEDRWLLLQDTLVLGAAWMIWWRQPHPFAARPWLLLLAVAILAAISLVGHYLVLDGYDMSRDEQLASFDADVFAHGHLVQTIPAMWRDHADALNTRFIYSAEHRGAWISGYLPLNAALRAVVGLFATPYLTGALLVAIGLLALWGCARRMWPDNREAAVVALLLYVGSGQIVVTGMTAFAMPAHLACNLVWLWLFLLRKWWADVAALIIGFVAIGLHQPLLHPMFAAPILFLLVLERQWYRAAFYGLGYAAIGAFWLWWPSWTWRLLQADPAAAPPPGVDFLTRLALAVRYHDPIGPAEMAANLLRFIAWQHIILVPLLIVGWMVARRNRLAGALAIGLILTMVVMAIILPYQGEGFGYRYAHGLIGSCILLAVYGWVSLGDRAAEWRRPLLATSLASVILILPFQLWKAHSFYAPAAVANAFISRIGTDYAVIGGNDAPFTIDLIYNPPALNERPIRLVGEEMSSSVIAAVCASHPTITLVGDRVFDAMNIHYGLAPRQTASERNRVLAPRLSVAGCRVASTP